jgi:ABC-2 type transport system permease protein
MMGKLVKTFLKIFFRNWQALFFVICLPLGIFLGSLLLGLKDIVRFDLPLPYYHFLLTGICALALMQTGIYTVTYSFVDYHRTSILKRLAVTPLTPGKFMLAQVIGRYVIALIQVGLLVGLGAVILKIPFHAFLLFVPITVFVGNTLFLAVGFLLASVAKDYEQAAPYTMITGTILLLLGNAFFPIKNLPRPLLVIADYLPLKPLVSFFRLNILGLNQGQLVRDGLVLLGWLFVILMVARYVFAKKLYR